MAALLPARPWHQLQARTTHLAGGRTQFQPSCPAGAPTHPSMAASARKQTALQHCLAEAASCPQESHAKSWHPLPWYAFQGSHGRHGQTEDVQAGAAVAAAQALQSLASPSRPQVRWPSHGPTVAVATAKPLGSTMAAVQRWHQEQGRTECCGLGCSSRPARGRRRSANGELHTPRPQAPWEEAGAVAAARMQLHPPFRNQEVGRASVETQHPAMVLEVCRMEED
mmetsp:Transcript_102422/g.330395  ORF Transcript_102422/g.330395 Transcript_102422/m.330395 type:complete len:225 (-) Transcript_102422:1148-1822(-)